MLNLKIFLKGNLLLNLDKLPQVMSLEAVLGRSEDYKFEHKINLGV